jgi:hypothetical protein
MPDEPEPGSPVSVLIDMVPDVSITDAHIRVNVELFGVTVPGGAHAYRHPHRRATSHPRAALKVSAPRHAACLTLDLCKIHACPVAAKKSARLGFNYSRE